MLLLVTACATDVGPPPASSAILTPIPPGAIAFCVQHSAVGDAACDPIPGAVAMPDGGAVMAPPAWHDFCRRHRDDPGCIA
ncbi:MAG: hypothetical protein H7268_05150 [Sandarakinorhabdus sp.]|nr:hypothetical protein [Sandarakinorhabdus sp.]